MPGLEQHGAVLKKKQQKQQRNTSRQTTPHITQKQVTDQYVLLTKTYGCQISSLIETTYKQRTAQTVMKRKMLDIKLQNKVSYSR